MLYLMKKRFFSLGNFTVTDQEGYEVFNIKRKWGFNKFSIETVTGKEEVLVQQKIFALRTTFHLYSNGQFYASVKKPFFTFYDNYTAELFNNDEMRIAGDFWNHEYNISSNQQGGLASVSKQWFSFTDSYGVMIDDRADAALILAFVLIISLCHNRREDSEEVNIIGGLWNFFTRE